ncbi:hypothetical protein IF128_12295 [Empedobacter stercoris]|uniref:Uncharacterized protein n=1 Tax=Empedobacter stercoris TaxID=1628248 RepID=A0ABX1WPN2_9FLAO|nr:hypothetical protein [Empedobacter stercoris]MCA4776787.1 hypothetical protein [Empedobacter stercoris]MCA4810508.1 hypothetical protein [Empedobacter stercoris]NOJ76486.1 hypothetical protein [Empedobacter stercoris]QNT15194.1 hypothetical protein HNV03_11305 [Empedobacter stercoris]
MKKNALLSIGKIALGFILYSILINLFDHSDLIIESFKTGFIEGFRGK